MRIKRSHMNYCQECRRAFQLKNDPDLCESCRIILGLNPGDISDRPSIANEIEERFIAFHNKALSSDWG